MIRRALLSAQDKRGVAELARGLAEQGVALVASGGTARHLAEQGIAVRSVEEVYAAPEMLGGRVKTLHAPLHASILARRDRDDDVRDLARLGLEPIDLVLAVPYDFAGAARSASSGEQACEAIDIGGPALLRAAAKNWRFVAALSRADQGAAVLREMRERGGALSDETRIELAREAFRATIAHDTDAFSFFDMDCDVAMFLAEREHAAACRVRIERDAIRSIPLRYGENPHQKGSLYGHASYPGAPGIPQAEAVAGGKDLSYNNILDLDAALGLARELAAPFLEDVLPGGEVPAAAVLVKHADACGAARAEDLAAAFEAAHACDPESAYGCVVALARAVDRATALALTEPGRFVEAVVAPSFAPEAVSVLRERPKWGGSVRLLTVPIAARPSSIPIELCRSVAGGVLLQTPDTPVCADGPLRVASRRGPTEAEARDLRFAWAAAKHARSNAIVLARERATRGIGSGQPSRVDAARIAVRKAGERARGAVLASDGFIPFPDTVEVAAAAGVTAVIEPGGSRRDDEVIAACDRLGLALVLTGRRHFRH